MPTFEAGQLFDRYRILRWLGSGVSGESYEAEDAMLSRKVTLKLIHPQDTLPDSARRQFFREMQGISGLNHPFIAQVLDYGEINSRLYVARRFVNNGSLLSAEGRLWFHAPLNVSDAINYAHQVAQALQTIHARGYVHGAVTFTNLLVLRGPNIDNQPDYVPFLLADAGLAQFTRRFGQLQQLSLPVSAAPEQIGKRVIPASDQFALAALLYSWLAGRPPYIGTPAEVERLKLTETIIPLSTINPRVSIEQDGMLLRALSVFPEDRYPTVLAFAAALLSTITDSADAPPIPASITIEAEPPTSLSEPTASAQTEPQPSDMLAQPASSPVRELPQTDAATQLEMEPAPEPTTIVPENTPEPAQPFASDLQTAFSPTTMPPMPRIPDTPALTPFDENEDNQPPACARVIITSPYSSEQLEVTLDHEEVTVGRAGSSDILLDFDNLTSRHHALFQREGQRYRLYDLRSANGVFINGQKINPDEGYTLIDGDHISIGNYELIFRVVQSDSSSAVNERGGVLKAHYEATPMI